MITAQHRWSGKTVCRLFSGFYMNRAFRKIHIIGPQKEIKKPVLMIGNHFSWWDGFIQYLLNDRIYKQTFHVMMLEEQLRRHKILNKAGAYSIRKQSRDTIQSLNYTIKLLEQPSNLVLLFPQGRIETLNQDTLTFEKGIDYLIQRVPQNVEVVFNVNLIDFHAEKKPTLYIYHQPVSWHNWKGKGTIEKKYNEYYQKCRSQQQKLWI